MDPLSITAGVVGVAVPALQCIHKLRKTIQAILDAPSEIASLGEELMAIEQAIDSLQEVSDQQWQSLGESVVTQSKTGMNLCRKSCNKFQAAIDHWTRHGQDGKLSWRDRTAIGIFGQDQIKSTSSQLQNCKNTLTWVVSIATLRNSLQQTSVNEETRAMVLTKEIEIAKVITTTERQLVEVNTRLDRLRLELSEVFEETPEQINAKDQVETERHAMQKSLDLLKTLNENVQSAANDIRKGQCQTVNTMSFGDHNRGVQTGISNAPINFSIGQGRGI
ncbi:ATP-nad kinase [Fusarium longipes]|uniref:ATP-nad kinase n=1 Tax=Fusarium longipes TaxID=694270 RepID=A0A395T0D8_9HYPO|nr:ATP-nad kinase [Fusarium longipes]